jgi:putative transposase
MSKKRTTYSSAFKTKLVLELLQNESTLAEIVAKHNILPQNLVNWKKAFLANAEIDMEPSKAVKEHKKYSYKLRGLNISHANQVWSTEHHLHQDCRRYGLYGSHH